MGEAGRCESRMAERIHWWTERWLRSPLFLSLSFSFSDYLPTYLPIYLCIYLSLSLCLSVYLSTCHLQAWKLSNSARIPQFLNLTTSKTKQFCETSLIFEPNNVKNKAILRDSFNFWTWQHQKQSNSAKLPSKIESWVQRWQPGTNAFCNFSTPPL